MGKVGGLTPGRLARTTVSGETSTGRSVRPLALASHKADLSSNNGNMTSSFQYTHNAPLSANIVEFRVVLVACSQRSFRIWLV